MTSIRLILITTLLPIGSILAQWPMPSRNMQPPPPPPQQQQFTNGQNRQQPPGNLQMYLYNPSVPPAPMQIQHQQSNYQWNNQPQNYPQQQQLQAQQKPRQKPKSQRVLVDYPFTVEYVDRSKNSGNSAAFNEDRKLIDYPFTVEYVDAKGNNNNPSNENPRGQGVFPASPDSFRFISQQQQQRPNIPQKNRPLAPNQSQNAGTGGYQNSAGGGYQNGGGGGGTVCSHPRCAASY